MKHQLLGGSSGASDGVAAESDCEGAPLLQQQHEQQQQEQQQQPGTGAGGMQGTTEAASRIVLDVAPAQQQPPAPRMRPRGGRGVAAPEQSGGYPRTCRICFGELASGIGRKQSWCLALQCEWEVWPPPRLALPRAHAFTLISLIARASLAETEDAPSDSDPSNPLISPCLCSGSSRYVHRACLAQWRASTHRRDAAYQCEVCHFRFGAYTCVLAASRRAQ